MTSCPVGTVVVVTENYQIEVNQTDSQIIEVNQTDSQIVEVVAAGPQGPIGPMGPIGPQGIPGTGVDISNAVDKSLVYYDGSTNSLKADQIWRVDTITDGGNF